MLKSIPLLIIPLVVFNLLVAAGTALDGELFRFTMMSGAVWSFSPGNALVTGALVLLFAEILKATRTGSASLIDHGLSLGLFVVFLIQFIIHAPAANSTFFLLMVIALIDVIGGYSITITAARRDVALDGMANHH